MALEGAWARDLLIFLVTAGIIVPLLGRARVGSVLGFLLAGVVLGPGGIGALAGEAEWLRYVTFTSEERVAPFAELGVLFLLFTVGLELTVSRLWAMRRFVLGAGLTQIAISTIVIALIASWLNVEATAAFVIGLGLAFSSTAIALQLLIQKRRLGSDVGRTTFGVLLMQDLMVVPGVILITILAGDSELSVPVAVLRGLGVAAGAVIIIFVAGRFVLDPLLRLAASTKSREIVVAIALLIAIGSAAATAAAGLSPALGAFLAGLLLASSEYRHQIEVDIDPFKGLLLGLFFMTVGMSIHVAELWEQLPVVIAGVAVLLLLKAVIAYGVVRLVGAVHVTAVETALLLAGAGEFAFVLFSLARQEALLEPEILTLATTITAVSMLLTPVLAAGANRWVARQVRRDRAKPDGELAHAKNIDNHIIVGGFGRVGGMIARLLEATSTPYVAVDLDAGRVAEARAEGKPVYYGDIGRHEILERLGADRAAGFVITSDLPVETDQTVAMIRSHWPNGKIFARSKDPAHARRLMGMGATDVVPEAMEGSLQLAGHVLIGIGLPEDAVANAIADVREALLHDIGPEQA